MWPNTRRGQGTGTGPQNVVWEDPQPATVEETRLHIENLTAQLEQAVSHRERLEALLRQIAHELAEDSGSLTSATAHKLTKYYDPNRAAREELTRMAEEDGDYA